MPPKTKDISSVPEDAVLGLQDWLKLLSSHGVSMRTGMTLAAKAYTDHNTKSKLKGLPAATVNEALPNKDDRKTVLNALKQIGTGQAVSKKRTRDDDLLRPLPKGDEIRAPESLSFDEIIDPEALLPISVTVNRAPVKCAWTYVVARRLGFDAQEALSIAQVYVHISSLKHALFLGNILNAQQVKEAEDEIRELPGEHDFKARTTAKDWKKGKPQAAIGSSQPWVGIMNSKPVIERPDGTWRAIQQGAAVEPSVAYLYITRALKTFAPHVLGAMQLVADSYEPQELDRVGLYLYSQFKPDVMGWGQRGTLQVAKILETMKDNVTEDPDLPTAEATEEAASGPSAEHQDDDQPVEITAGGDSGKETRAEDSSDRMAKRAKLDNDKVDSEATAVVVAEEEPEQSPESKEKPGMTLEEYEAMLDAEAADWDFPEGI